MQYHASFVAKRFAKRVACFYGPSGVAGYHVTRGDTAAAFLAQLAFSAAAAQTITPPSYSNTFINKGPRTSALFFMRLIFHAGTLIL
jgi:hypothetical protein